MRTVLITLLFFVAVRCYSTTVEETANLRIYYPDYSRIDLVCGETPNGEDKSVDFCCSAAFTGQLLDTFAHSIIADNHISGGTLYKGYKCRANKGMFTWGPQGWRFAKKAAFPAKADGLNVGFCQLPVVLNGVEQPIGGEMKGKWNIYRALCEKDGRLCIVQSKKVVSFGFFVRCLLALKVTNALYLDMGSGWNYAWYRDVKGIRKEVFPESKKSYFYTYRTNSITFYK